MESRTQGSRPRPRTHNKIRGQGQGKPFRGQTLSRPRTGMLEAKDQGHKWKCSPKKKSSSKKFFRRSQKKNLQKKIFQAFSTKKRLLKFFSGVRQNLNNSKKVLSSSQGQGNFRGLEASRPRPRT